MKMQGIASTGIIHPQTSLSVVHICQLCAYRMRNMTICKQFNGVQDSLEFILCWNSQPRKSDATNCHYRYHIPPKVIIKIPNIWQCHASRMHNMTIHNQFHALRDELEQIQFQTFYAATMKMQGIAITGTIHPQKSSSVVHIYQRCAYRLQNITIRKQFDGLQDFLESILCHNSQPHKSDTRNCC
jgi:hypothetical protein